MPDGASDDVDVDLTSDEENEDQYNLARELDKVTYKEGPKVMSLANIISDPEKFGFMKTASGEPISRSASTALNDNIERLPNANQMIEAIVQTFSNICLSAKSNHLKLLDLGLMDEIKSLLQLYVPYEYGSPVKQPID
jgi:hypothetical protein